MRYGFMLIILTFMIGCGDAASPVENNVPKVYTGIEGSWYFVDGGGAYYWNFFREKPTAQYVSGTHQGVENVIRAEYGVYHPETRLFTFSCIDEHFWRSWRDGTSGIDRVTCRYRITLDSTCTRFSGTVSKHNHRTGSDWSGEVSGERVE